MEHIEILPIADPRVSAFIKYMEQNMLTIVNSLQLFSDKRLMSAEVVAMLSFRGFDSGMATLSSSSEIGNRSTPHIDTLWIEVKLFQHPQVLQFGVEMIRKLASKAKERYQKVLISR